MVDLIPETTAQAQSGAGSMTALVGRVRRIAGHTMWTGAGFAVALGVDKLVVCPVLNWRLGEDVFGAFVWTLGIVSLFGNVAANSFAILLLRDIGGYDKERASRAVRSALVLSAAISTGVLIVASVASYALAEATVREYAMSLYLPLGLYALARSFEIILVVNLRVRRKFALMFLIRLVEGAILLVNLAVAPSQNLWAVGGVYVASIIAALPLYAVWSDGTVGRGAWWDGGLAGGLMAGWTAGALMTFMEQAQVYLPRLVLGADTGDVAVLYAGTSIGNLFVAPVGLLGSVVLSLLASHRLFALRGRLGTEYLAVSVVLAVVVGCVSWLAGRWLIIRLYPDLSVTTLEFYGWIALGNGFMSLALLFRPVAVRYLPLGRVAAVSAVTVAVQVAALAALVPSGKAHGAAMSLAGSSFVACVLWLACFIRARRDTTGDHIEPISEEGMVDS